MSGDARIRRYRPADLDALYRICLLTADNGQDASQLYPDGYLPGHLFAAPYGLFEPALAFVAEDADGVAGYVLGALDTGAFERRLERDWWPRLRGRYPDPPRCEQLSLPPQLLAREIHHPFRAPAELTRRFPSHLHIDLLPRQQGRGLGRGMIARLTAELRDRGSDGVHLGTSEHNRRAVGFYHHLGFTLVASPDSFRIFGLDLHDQR
ncbi:MAG TPA: GNAT family N-acetyltransferase [Streptosporangiaceae bacterium]|jgi:ribosomal protein S18 acetylase RimI-like enzyme